MARRWGAVVGLGGFLLARSAGAVEIPTIYDNSRPYPVGSRAAGMGGAYTALGCDEAALHYNVAALGCSGSSRLELSANAYLLQFVSIPKVYGPNQAMEAATYHGIPSIVGGVRVLEEGDARGVGRWVFGLSVELPRSIALKVGPKDTSRPNYITFAVRDDLTTGDIGLGWQMSRQLAFGLGVGAVLRTYEGHISTLMTGAFQPECFASFNCADFLVVTDAVEHLAVAGRAKAGVRFTPSRDMAFGLSLQSPTLDVYGSSQIIRTSAVALEAGGVRAPVPVRLSGDSEVALPPRVALGAAYMTDKLKMSMDLSLAFPTTVVVADNLTASPIAGVATPTLDELAAENIVLRRTWQPNLNIGVEVEVSSGVVIDYGFFSDISSVSPEDADELAHDRIHLFGGTLALGLLGDQARGWFGVSCAYGRAGAKVVEGDFGVYDVLANGGNFAFDAHSSITRWNIAGFIGSNYSFAPESDDDDED